MFIFHILLTLFVFLCQVQITQQALARREQEQVLAPFIQALESEQESSKPPDVIPDFPNLFEDQQWMYPKDRGQS